jgi:hypothetical protein
MPAMPKPGSTNISTAMRDDAADEQDQFLPAGQAEEEVTAEERVSAVAPTSPARPNPAS